MRENLKKGIGMVLFEEIPATTFNNSICVAEVIRLTKVYAPCCPFIIEINVRAPSHAVGALNGYHVPLMTLPIDTYS